MKTTTQTEPVEIVHYANPYTGVRRIEKRDSGRSSVILTSPLVPVILSRDVHSLCQLLPFIEGHHSFVLTRADDRSDRVYVVALDANPLTLPKYTTRNGYQSLRVDSDGSPIRVESFLEKIREIVVSDFDRYRVEISMVMLEDDTYKIFARRSDPWIVNIS